MARTVPAKGEFLLGEDIRTGKQDVVTYVKIG